MMVNLNSTSPFDVRNSNKTAYQIRQITSDYSISGSDHCVIPWLLIYFLLMSFSAPNMAMSCPIIMGMRISMPRQTGS